MVHFGKSANVPAFVRLPSAFLLVVRRNQSGYLTFRTNKVEDTK